MGLILNWPYLARIVRAYSDADYAVIERVDTEQKIGAELPRMFLQGQPPPPPGTTIMFEYRMSGAGIVVAVILPDSLPGAA